MRLFTEAFISCVPPGINAGFSPQHQAKSDSFQSGLLQFELADLIVKAFSGVVELINCRIQREEIGLIRDFRNGGDDGGDICGFFINRFEMDCEAFSMRCKFC